MADTTDIQINYTTSRVRVAFPQDLIAEVSKVLMDEIEYMAKEKNIQPQELELPAIALLRSILIGIGLPPESTYRIFQGKYRDQEL